MCQMVIERGSGEGSESEFESRLRTNKLGAKLFVMGFYAWVGHNLILPSPEVADLDDDDDGIIEAAICGRNKHWFYV